jgi:hypothetical protein
MFRRRNAEVQIPHFIRDNGPLEPDSNPEIGFMEERAALGNDR